MNLLTAQYEHVVKENQRLEREIERLRRMPVSADTSSKVASLSANTGDFKDIKETKKGPEKNIDISDEISMYNEAYLKAKELIDKLDMEKISGENRENV